MGYMDHTLTYNDADMERLYSHNETNVGDSETQEPNDLHGGIGTMHGEQFEDPTTRELGSKELRTISKYIC
jgi:hypothetical protein